MNVLRYVTPSLLILFCLYCVLWSFLASSSPISQRVGAAFLGVLFLLLALVYVRVIIPHEREEIVH